MYADRRATASCLNLLTSHFASSMANIDASARAITRAPLRQTQPSSRRRRMSIFLRKASKARIREAENARKNRLEIVKALSHGKVTRRELIKWGLFTAGGVL